MTVFVLCLLSIQSSYFLRLSPGVMSQGLGGVSILIDEGLAAFHNPAYLQETKFNFTLSRWLYSTNLFTIGTSYKDNVIGISYLNYGNIQGYDEYGYPTNKFNPFNMCLVFARKFNSFGVFVKSFGEKIDSYALYGLCGGVSSYVDLGKVCIGAKIDNLGKEFSENTTIPFTTAFGLKFTLPENLILFIESKSPLLELNTGLLYKYDYVKLLLGAKYIRPEDLISGSNQSFQSSDLNFSGGLIICVENYEIGYSFLYTEFSNAHQFSITFVP